MADKLLAGVYKDVQPIGTFLRVEPKSPSEPLKRLLESVYVGQRRAVSHTGLPDLHVPERCDILQVIRLTIRRSLSAGVRCVLSKGHRLNYESLRTSADTATNVTANLGTTHKDQFVRREWYELHGLIGASRFLRLFSDPRLAMFRTLPNNCLLQLTGVPFDEDLREVLAETHRTAVSRVRSVRGGLVRSSPDRAATASPSVVGDAPSTAQGRGAGATASAPASPPGPAPPQLDPIATQGWWQLPRGDMRASGPGTRGRWLLYCRPLFHQAFMRGHRQVPLPTMHILNEAAAGQGLLHMYDRLGSSEEAAFLSGTAAGAAAASGPTPAISKNSARRLVRHIFIDAPHIRDLWIFNGLPLSHELERLARAPTAIPAPSAPSPSSSAPADSTNTSTGSLGARQPSKSGPLAVEPVPGVTSESDTTKDLPKALQRSVPVFVELLARHAGSIDYAGLLEKHCPRKDRKRARGSSTAADAAGGLAPPVKLGSKRSALGIVEGMPHAKRQRTAVGHSASSAQPSASENIPEPLGPDAPPEPLPGSPELDRPLTLTTPHEEVMSYLRTVLSALLPPQLWGNTDSRRHILGVVWRWVVMGKRDRISIEEVVHGLPTGPFAPVFGSNPAQCAQLVRCWLIWLLLGFVNPLLAGAFYITGSEATHQRPLYYRKPTWGRLARRALEKLRRTLQLAPLGQPSGTAAPISRSFSSATAAVQWGSSSSVSHPATVSWGSGASSSASVSSSSLGSIGSSGGPFRPLGVAPIRLVPKSNGLRTIMNLSCDQGAMRRALAATATGASTEQAGGVSRQEDLAARVSASAALASLEPGGAQPSATAAAGHVPFTRPINKQLDSVHEVLKLVRRERPAIVGSAVFGMDVMYASLRQFALARKAGGVAAGPNRPLFIISCDITAAYDSILQPKLLQVLDEVLAPYKERTRGGDGVAAFRIAGSSGFGPATTSSTEFEVRSFAVVMPAAADPVADWHDDGTAAVSTRVRYRKVAVPLSDRRPFYVQVEQLALETHDAVFIDGGMNVRVSAVEVAKTVRRHVENHVIRLPSGLVAAQRCGIPQGSILSSLLCNAYLGHMEANSLLPRVFALAQATRPDGTAEEGDVVMGGQALGAATAPGPSIAPVTAPPIRASLLMRLTDDFLLLSEDERLAHAFAQVMHRGEPSYNVVVTPVKTESSFPVTIHAPPSNTASGAATIAPLPAGTPVSWCGFHFDASTGAVTADYGRYRGRGKIADALTFNYAPSAVEAVAKAMRSSLRPKCHPVLLDGVLNSLGTVALNLYHICLLGGAKMLVMMNRAPGGRPGAQAIMSQLQRALRYLQALIRKRCPVRVAPLVMRRALPGAAPSSGGSVVPSLDALTALSGASGSELPAQQAESLFMLGQSNVATVAGPAPDAPAHGVASEFALPSVEVHSVPQEPPPPSWCPLRQSEVAWLFHTAMHRCFAKVDSRHPGIARAILAARAGLAHRPSARAHSVRGSQVPVMTQPSQASSAGGPALSSASAVAGTGGVGSSGGPRMHGWVRAMVRAQVTPSHSLWFEDVDLN